MIQEDFFLLLEHDWEMRIPVHTVEQLLPVFEHDKAINQVRLTGSHVRPISSGGLAEGHSELIASARSS